MPSLGTTKITAIEEPKPKPLLGAEGAIPLA